METLTERWQGFQNKTGSHITGKNKLNKSLTLITLLEYYQQQEPVTEYPLAAVTEDDFTSHSRRMHPWPTQSSLSLYTDNGWRVNASGEAEEMDQS